MTYQPYPSRTLAALVVFGLAIAFCPGASAQTDAAQTDAAPRIDLSTVPHDPGPTALAPVTELARWPAGSFLESIVALGSGDFLIAESTTHRIFRASPTGAVSGFHESDIQPMALAVGPDETIVATGKDHEGTNSFLFVFGADGALERRVPVPEAGSLNGCTFLAPGIVLANDAALGRIYRIELASGTVTTWIADERLTPDPTRSELLPGVNGVKVFDGAVYASNSSRAIVMRVPIMGPEQAAGALEVIHRDLVVDDFCIGDDGTIYGTTHIFDGLVRLRPDGSVTRLAGAEEGMAGSTAVVFGRGPSAGASVYVVADGGYYLTPGAAGPAYFTRVDVGQAAAPRAAALRHVAYPGRASAGAAAMVTCYTAPDAAAARERAAGAYTRFLELNHERVLLAGQIGDPSAAPTARVYLIDDARPADALAMMEASPYYVEGVYDRCEVQPFQPMLGRLLGGVAWDEKTSD